MRELGRIWWIDLHSYLTAKKKHLILKLKKNQISQAIGIISVGLLKPYQH